MLCFLKVYQLTFSLIPLPLTRHPLYNNLSNINIKLNQVQQHMYAKLAKTLFLCSGGFYTLSAAIQSYQINRDKIFMLLGNGLKDLPSREINNFSNFRPHRIVNFAKHKQDIKFLEFGPVFDAAIVNPQNVLYVWIKKQFTCNLKKGDVNEQLTSNPIKLMSNISSVKFTKNRVWALTKDGKIFYWKVNYQNKSKIIQPQEIFDLSSAGVIQIASGVNHILFLNNKGEVYGMGENGFCQCGNKDSKENIVKRPKKIENLPYIKKIFCGSTHSLAIDENGKLYGWGSNSKMQLSNEKSLRYIIEKPEQIKGKIEDLYVEEVSAGNQFTIIYGKNKKKNEYEVYSTGANQKGQLALNMKSEWQDMSLVESLSNFQKNGQPVKIDKIQCGKNHCIAKLQNYVFSWGSNQFGEQANMSIQNVLTPKILKFDNHLIINQVYAGQNATGIILEVQSQGSKSITSLSNNK